MKKILIILFLSITFFVVLSSPTKVLAVCTLNGVSVATGTQFCRGESYTGQVCTNKTEYGTCQASGAWLYNSCAAGTSCAYSPSATNVSCLASCVAPPPPPPGPTHTCYTACDSFAQSAPISDSCSNHGWRCEPWTCTPPPPLPPTCTFTASPTPINFGETSTLSWTTTNATSFVINQGVGLVSPTAGGSVSVSPVVSTAYNGAASGLGGTTFCIANVTVIPPAPWTQGKGGDMRGDTSLVNQIPITVPSATRYFSISNSPFTTLLPGIAFGIGLNLGNNGTNNVSLANPNNRYVNVNYAGGVIRTSYAFIEDTLRKNGIPNTPSDTNISSIPSSGVHSNAGSVTFSNPTGLTFNGGNYIFLIDGDININSDITVPAGNTVFFIATGDINVAENVEEIQGIFSADDSFVVEGNSDPTLNRPLEVQGNIIGNAAKNFSGGYANNRNLGITNATTPSVSIIYRPDFVLFAPQFIRYTNYTIKEVAPGSD